MKFFYSDLAVLRLAEPLPEFHNSIEPAILSTAVPVPASVCRLVGWGELFLEFQNILFVLLHTKVTGGQMSSERRLIFALVTHY